MTDCVPRPTDGEKPEEELRAFGSQRERGSTSDERGYKKTMPGTVCRTVRRDSGHGARPDLELQPASDVLLSRK